MMQTTYPTIEPAPEEQPDAHADGAAILLYTIRNGWPPLVTATRYERAIAQATIAQARRPDEHPAAVATIAQAQRELYGALRRALDYERAQATEPEPEPAPTQAPTHEGNAPTHPIPFTRPPAADTARRPAVAGGHAIAF